MTEKISYFEFQAEIGATKHIGGIEATDRLAELCRIKKESRVLEVGCGVGLTSAYLADKFGCRVTGIDISRGMIEKAKETAGNEGVYDKTEFMVADAQELPFENESFDAVILESVMAFIPDRKKAMKEFIRVLRPGGYVGITEAAWIKEPPEEYKKKMNEFVEGNILDPEGWKSLFMDAGLEDITAETHEIDMKAELWNGIRRWSIIEYLKVQYRFWKGIFTKPTYRRLIADSLKLPLGMIRYWGYGVYSGRKKS